MRALFYVAPGRLEWREVESPRLLDPEDAIIRPTAVAACDLDRAIAQGSSPFPGPFMLGHEFCGEVMETGEAVEHLVPGDRVIASFQPSCGRCGYCSHGHTSVCSSVPVTSMYGIGPAGGDWSGAIAGRIRVPWANGNLRKLPDGVDPVAVASGSDNLADGLRAVDLPLQIRPDSSVLIAGEGSIPLYAVLCARHLNVEQVTLASRERFALEVGEALGAEVIEITKWPRRLSSHEVTFDCTNDPQGLGAVIRSTAPHGICTSASIYFQETTDVPLRDMYMKGISFHTGRVNSAAQLDRVLDLVVEGLAPMRINPAVVCWDDAIGALKDLPRSQKVVLRSA